MRAFAPTCFALLDDDFEHASAAAAVVVFVVPVVALFEAGVFDTVAAEGPEHASRGAP